MSRFLLLALIVVSSVARLRAEDAPYTTVDDSLRVVKIDSSPDESFLAVECDSMGRLFVGGREALFVYDVNADGSYAPRKELYRFPPDSWIYNIAVRGHDLYVLTSQALYLIPDAVVNREGLAPQRLIWGLPRAHVHQCYHGMTIGPEGDIYFASGDPLWYYGDFERPDHWGHWTIFSQPEGTKTSFTGVGGVFRCRPDGTNFQVVATGLRNSCGLAFDHDWNLFTNDNDHEGMPSIYVPGRLVHVTPHAYFNWPRGWLTSKSPERADMLETMNDHLGRYVPVGQTYYDDSHLGDQYRDNLIVARWGARIIARYPLEHRGASFKAEEKPVLECRDLARPVNVCVGRGGRVFATIAYMPQNESSPHYPSDLIMIERKEDTNFQRFEPFDLTEAPLDTLFDDLSGEWSEQFAAHQELMRRGPEAFAAAAAKLKDPVEGPLGLERQNHLIWLAAAGRTRAVEELLLAKVAPEAPDAMRQQALRALIEFYPTDLSRDMLVGLLSDSDPQMQLAAMWGLFARDGDCPREVVDGPAHSDDTYLRQAATMLMAERLSLDELRMLSDSPDTKTRLAATLAAGFRLTIPSIHDALDPAIKLDVLRENEGYEVDYAGEKIDLRKFGPIGNFTTADAWKQVEHSSDQEALFTLLSRRLTDPDKRTQLQAAHFLYMLNDSRSEPQVAAVFAADEERRLGILMPKNATEVWVAGPFDDAGEGFKKIHGPQEGVIDLAATYQENGRDYTWQKIKTKRQFVFGQLLGPYQGASVYAYFKLASGSKQRGQLLIGSDDGVQVWHNGNLVWTNDIRRPAQAYEDVVNLQLEAGSNDILIRTRSVNGQTQLYISYKGLQPVEPIATDKVDTASLAERLASTGGSYTVPPEFLAVDWSEYIKEGDAEQGRKLFDSIGCAKCHAATTDSTVVGGPSLAEAVKRFTVPNMVESVLLPSQQISPVFRATSILTVDGRQFVGLVISETGDKLELLLQDTNKVSIAKADIDEREVLNQSPMPPGIVKKPEELRDLLAYLLRKA